MVRLKNQPKLRTNLDTDFLKLIAVLSMTVDHVGAVFFPEYPVFRWIGRMAFPLFCYCMTVGLLYTHDIRRYLARLGVFALLSQPFWILAFNADDFLGNLLNFNIFFTLFVSLLAMWGFKEHNWPLFLGCVLLLAFVLLWLTPLWETVDRKYYGAPFGRYAKAFGIGFAVLAGVPLAAILLFISNVGVRLALIVLFLYAAAIIAAPVFLGFFLGALLWRGAMKKAPCYYAELAIGILVWRVAASVPGLSFAVGLVSVPLGLGVVTLLLGKGAAKPSPKAETACEECAASDPAALPEDSDSAEQ